jgi:PAS domain S-box-containing protein
MQGPSTILIADDDRGVHDLFSFVLPPPDYRLLFADNGNEAVAAAFEQVPDLVLLDVVMPKMDGFEVCRRLRSDPRTKELPIIIITALYDRDSRLRGIEAGADDFITKPFDIDELQARLRSIARLNRYRALLTERAKFVGLFDLSPDGIIIVDSGQEIILANPAFRRMIGAEEGEGLQGVPVTSLFAPDQAITYEDLLKGADDPSRPLIETAFLRRDGSRLPVELSAGGVLHGTEGALYLIARNIEERKRFQEDLKESEKKHRELIENIEDVVYVTDGRGFILFLNDAMERSFGYTKEEIIGKRFTEFIVPEEGALAESLFRKQLSGEHVGTFELSFLNRQGKRITLELREKLIWDDGKVVEAHGIGRDVTERRRIQEELRKSEERFGTLFKTSKDVIVICDSRDRFIDANPAGEQLLDYSRDELLGLGLRDICVDPRDIGRFHEIMARDGFVKDFEMKLMGRDSSTMDCVVTATESVGLAGEKPGFQGIIRDITERKRFVDLTLDGINDGVFTVDGDLKITYINSAAEDILGITREKSIGEDCRDVVWMDGGGDDSFLKKVLDSNEKLIQKRVTLVGPGQMRVPVSLSATALRNRDGASLGVVVIFRDLSAIEALRKEIESSYTFEDIISKNHRMREIFSTLPDISESGSNVLIEGRSGTGKELFARAIHNLSSRKNGPFIAVNCSAIPETLLESELFGYVKGAFTNALVDKPGRFALAEGGTLFLDEIADLPKTLQVKLLRVIEEREYDPLGAVASVKTNARIIASSNRGMAREVGTGAFREDLFYRLNVLRISLPDLKERREDIPLLIDHFLKIFSGRLEKNVPVVSEDVMQFMMGYDYPGNVRELENIIEHASVLCRQGVILMEHLPKELIGGLSPATGTPILKSHVMDSEKELIRTTLAQHEGDRGKAARALNIGRTSLWRKMKKYHLL